LNDAAKVARGELMTFRFGAATTLSLTAIVLVACGGKTISIGSESTAQTVVPSAVTVATSACSQGFEHGNICCTGGGNGSDSSCESWPDDPFHPCDSGWTTYPNAATCCSLDNPSDCTGSCGSGSVGNQGECQIGPTPITPDAGFTDAGIPAENCETRCPPGYTGISPYDSKGCCRSNGDGSSECFGEVSATATSTPDEDAGLPPILLPDGGVYDGGVVDAGTLPGDSIDAGLPTPTVACEFNCPDGWFVADAVEGVCCNNTSSGGEECFAAVFPDDNGGGGGSDVPPSSTSTPPSIIDASAAPSH
jgi:hypothetical protein